MSPQSCPYCETVARQSRLDGRCAACGKLLPEELRPRSTLKHWIRKNSPHDLDLLLFSVICVCYPVGLLYLLVWYVEKSAPALVVAWVVLTCYALFALYRCVFLVRSFFTVRYGWAEGAGPMVLLAMMIQVVYLIPVVIVVLILKWVF